MAKPLQPMRPNGEMNGVVTADTPLTPEEQRFITEYIRTSSGKEARRIVIQECADKKKWENFSPRDIILRPNVQAEIKRIMDELRKESLATAEEVMSYFTSVMRGEVKDQFGLDAPLSERTKAAQELAKRTIDIENRAKGNADTLVQVKVDWRREA